MITEDILAQIPTADLPTLYKIFRILRTNNREIMEKNYQKVRNGINIQFSIHDYFEKKFTEKVKEGTIKIRNQRLDIEDFRTELEEREDLMRTTIILELEKGGTLTGR